jgi:16S rRNA (guanine966-N2)-methyltransferase
MDESTNVQGYPNSANGDTALCEDGGMTRPRKRGKSLEDATQTNAGRDTELRIIGGEFRGRRLRYHGDPVVRPMKHRVREAIFNLVSTESAGRHAIDLFAGTGALGLEALSRGAASATFIEKHVPSARVVEENIAALGVQDRATVLVTSAFLWSKRDIASASDGPPAQRPWLVFCSPPYDFYVDRPAEMHELIERIAQHAPPASTLVVEADQRFDFRALIGDNSAAWDVREYPPAVVGIWRIEST